MDALRKLKRLLEAAFFGVQPATVGADGIDFAVVGHEAERLRQRPARLRVGRVALVEDGKRSLKFGIREIRIKRRQLVGRQKTFVDDGPRGK